MSEGPAIGEFDPALILAVLVRHDVQFVVIGGVAAQLHGSPFVTADVDVVPASNEQNLTRMSDALTELNARLRHPDIPEGLPFGHDATSLRAAIFWNLTTDHGDLDISFTPSGTAGYDDLIQQAVTTEALVVEVPVRVAALEDIIRSKQAANRPKDQRVLPTLRELLLWQERDK